MKERWTENSLATSSFYIFIQEKYFWSDGRRRRLLCLHWIQQSLIWLSIDFILFSLVNARRLRRRRTTTDWKELKILFLNVKFWQNDEFSFFGNWLKLSIFWILRLNFINLFNFIHFCHEHLHERVIVFCVVPRQLNDQRMIVYVLCISAVILINLTTGLNETGMFF